VNREAEAELIRPLPAQSNDGNPWVDGWCWLWCGHRFTRVLWIGAIGAPGATSPLFACGPCIQLLHNSVWDYADAQHDLPEDQTGRAIPLYASDEATVVRRRRGRHRRPRTPLGQRFHRAITGIAEPDPIGPRFLPCRSLQQLPHGLRHSGGKRGTKHSAATPTLSRFRLTGTCFQRNEENDAQHGIHQPAGP
jgi:hypothetical protein